MRPLSLVERDLPEAPTVSFSDVLSGSLPSVSGDCSLRVEDYCGDARQVAPSKREAISPSDTLVTERIPGCL